MKSWKLVQGACGKARRCSPKHNDECHYFSANVSKSPVVHRRTSSLNALEPLNRIAKHCVRNPSRCIPRRLRARKLAWVIWNRQAHPGRQEKGAAQHVLGGLARSQVSVRNHIPSAAPDARQHSQRVLRDAGPRLQTQRHNISVVQRDDGRIAEDFASEIHVDAARSCACIRSNGSCAP